MHDFVVIGSGVSGARIACELVAGGARCLLLEAGRRFDRHSFPGNELDYSTQMFWNGGIEISRDGRLGFLRGKCLGGTSVVNQADLDRFDELAWEDWRARSGIDELCHAHYTAYYDYVLRDVACTTIPQAFHNRNARLFARAFDRLGLHWQPLHRAQSDCAFEHGSDCIVCLGGCPRDAKQSALVTSLPRGVSLGLEIETDAEAESLEYHADRVEIVGRQHGNRQLWKGRKVVLAAGALGNTQLLLKSREIATRLPALGRGFCCHPQFMRYGLFAEPVDAHKGPLQAVQAHDTTLRRAGVKFENVYAPPIATAMLIPGVGRTHHARMRKYRYLASFEVAVRDEPAGRIRLTNAGKLVVDKPLTAQDRARIRHGLEWVDRMLTAVEPLDVIRCEQGFGLHLMGGCALGNDLRTSVVNAEFQVHGHPNLYAADSSVFPSAPGINPSFTIMALGVRASERMLGRASMASARPVEASR